MATFPLVYVGCVLSYVVLDGPRVWRNLPTLEAHLASSPMPASPSTVGLVLVSFGLLLPALHLWRAALKKLVFAPIAERWAGLLPSSSKHEKFIEQAWCVVVACSLFLFCFYSCYSWRM